jgi:hypothetical protein
VREAWLCVWEMQDAGLELDETLIASLREVDRHLLPEADVGLYIKWNVVWAQKAGLDA